MGFQHLGWSALVYSIDLDTLAHQFGSFYHLRCCHTCLLIEGILEEFFLEPEVLRLLFAFAFALQVHNSVHLAQFPHLLVLLLLNMDVLEDILASLDFVFMAAGFLCQEIITFVFGPH